MDPGTAMALGSGLNMASQNYMWKQSQAHSRQAAKDAFEQTIHLRKTADLDKVESLRMAGLNPALAYGQGAQTASGVQAAQPQQQELDPVGKALEVVQMKNAKAMADKTSAEADTIKTNLKVLKKKKQIESNIWTGLQSAFKQSKKAVGKHVFGLSDEEAEPRKSNFKRKGDSNVYYNENFR